jgi:hypothetical protein
MRCDGVTAIIAPSRLSKSSPEHEAGGEKQYLKGHEINSFVAGEKKRSLNGIVVSMSLLAAREMLNNFI